MGFDADNASLWHLEELLLTFEIDSTRWKSGKTPTDLLEEMRAGESRLVIARMVEVVKMQILCSEHPGLELVELGKLRKNGAVVMHDKPRAPSGKKGTNETPLTALERELGEELHLASEDVSLMERGVKVEVEDSRSFTGIYGIYRLHQFELLLDESAEAKLRTFWSEEQQRYEIPDDEGKGVTLYFAWVPLSK